MALSLAVANPRAVAGKRVAVIGAGKIGGILLRALLDEGLLDRSKTCATVQHAARVRALSDEFRVGVSTDNVAAVRASDVILICLKPQQIKQALEEVRPAVTPDKLFISVAASVPTAFMEKALGGNVPVVRAMPNTPCSVRSGMTAICKGAHANDSHLEIATALFETVGRTVIVDEKHMDAITGLSASGPAYIYIILESLAEAGVKVGLPRDLATFLAAQTTFGAAKVVLDTGDHPALLKDAVTTPAGCTVDGIMELEEGKLRVTLIKAVVKAANRARELMFSH
ncbi:MAG: pyrroline-5-carboxylate reductase [Terriglobales bacterium]